MTQTESKRPRLSRRRLILTGGGGAVALAVALAGGAYWRAQAPDHDNRRLSVAEAHDQLKSGAITLVDIRTSSEWRATGIADGSHPLDMRRKDFIAALDHLVEQDRSAPIALICARGVRSARMTLALSAAGFSNIIDVPEGMLGSRAGPGWLASNLPVVTWDG